MTTLLAVDDSNTMRRVLEITFAGEDDLEVVLASGSNEALGLLGEKRPSLVLVDVTLGAVDGYALCQQIKQASPRTPVVILSSKQNPYDPSRGAACGADDHVDKPFDTQALIERVRGILERVPAQVEEPPQPQVYTEPPAYSAAVTTPSEPPMIEEPMVVEPEYIEPEPVVQLVQPVPAPPPIVHEPAAAGVTHQPAVPIAAVPIAAVPIAAAPVAAAPVAAAPPPVAVSPIAASSIAAVAAHTLAAAPPPPSAGRAAAAEAARAPASGNGLSAMKGRLGELGLTQDQVAAVLALSREVIEQAVWEVVPTLAETLIKEEIARLTRE